MKAIVYEPFQHFIPTGEGWARGLEDLGFEVYRIPCLQYRIAEIDEEVDLFIVHSPNDQNVGDIIHYKQSFPKARFAVLTDHWHPHFELLKDHVDLWFELAIQHQYSKAEFDKRGMPFGYVQLSAHRKDFYPTNVEKNFDVSFVGQLSHGYREEDKWLHPVLEKGYNGIFGGGYSYNGRHYPHIGHDRLNEIYNQTKVNINFHYPLHKREDPNNLEYRLEINGRVFEIALSGNFQISDNPLVKDYFGDSIPVAPPDKWLETIDYYIAHPEERAELAKKAHIICTENHTYMHRAKKILTLLKML